jgi:hypothetical protein
MGKMTVCAKVQLFADNEWHQVGDPFDSASLARSFRAELIHEQPLLPVRQYLRSATRVVETSTAVSDDIIVPPGR